MTTHHQDIRDLRVLDRIRAIGGPEGVEMFTEATATSDAALLLMSAGQAERLADTLIRAAYATKGFQSQAYLTTERVRHGNV